MTYEIEKKYDGNISEDLGSLAPRIIKGPIQNLESVVSNIDFEFQGYCRISCNLEHEGPLREFYKVVLGSAKKPDNIELMRTQPECHSHEPKGHDRVTKMIALIGDALEENGLFLVNTEEGEITFNRSEFVGDLYREKDKSYPYRTV